MMSDACAETLRRWHEAAYRELQERGEQEVSYLGRTFLVPADVFAPTPVSDLLGASVLTEVKATDRVLDMGTGCGANAILAAGVSKDVVGVDINPSAVKAATANAVRNGVAARTTFLQGDVFGAVDDTFDVIVFDPPFRWFRPRDPLEASIADEGYAALTRFMAEAADYLEPDGRILLFFGTSGDMRYLETLIERQRFAREVLATRRLVKEGVEVTYSTLRLTRTVAGGLSRSATVDASAPMSCPPR